PLPFGELPHARVTSRSLQWTQIYQVKLPPKILFLHVEPSFFLFKDSSFAHFFTLDFRLAESGEALHDLAGLHASRLCDAERGGVHVVLELLDDEIPAVHRATRLQREIENAVAEAVRHHAAHHLRLRRPESRDRPATDRIEKSFEIFPDVRQIEAHVGLLAAGG